MFWIQLRRGSMTVSEEMPSDTEVTLRVTTTTDLWRKVLARDASSLWAYLTGKLSVKPHILKLSSFASCFDTSAFSSL